MSTTYDPAVDSTPGLQHKARDSGRLWLDISDSACLCGCKDPTPGRFRPGHDARLKGKLLRAHLAKAPLTVVKDGKETQKTARAYAKEVSSERHDWTVALDRAVERQRLAAAALREKVLASTEKEKEEEVEVKARDAAVAAESGAAVAS